MGYIYKITNSINGRVYIGQTRRNVRTRWREHIYYSYHQAKHYHAILHAAIRKYGKEAFEVSIIEECENDRLNEREIYWIKQYNSIKEGYNISRGGDGGSSVDGEEIFSLWQSGLCAKEIAKKLSLNGSTVTRCLYPYGISKKEILLRAQSKGGKKRCREVHQYDDNGNFLKTFSSIVDARKSIDGMFIYLPDGKARKIGGFWWSMVKVDHIDVEGLQKQKSINMSRNTHVLVKPVYQYTMDGKYIREYASALEAAKTFGLHGSWPILSCCTGRSRYSHGYRWSHEKVDQLPEMRKDRGIRPIVQLDDDFNVIEIFPKISDACKKFGVTPGAIVPVCNGQHPKGVGYKWMFLEDYEEVKNERIS